MKNILKDGASVLLRKQSSVLSAAFVVMCTYALTNLIGLIRTRLLVDQFFGQKAHLLDVYYAAFLIPDTIFQLLVLGAISAAFIPSFAKLLAHDNTRAWRVANQSIGFVLTILCILSLIAGIFALPLANAIAPGFSDPQTQIMVTLLRIMLAAQIPFALSAFFTGILHSYQRFLIPALAPLLYNVGIILGILFLAPSFGIFGPAIGVVFGACLHMLIQLPVVINLGWRPKEIGKFDDQTKEIVKHMPARILTIGIDQIEQYVAVFLSSLLSAGSLSILSVARTLYSIPTVIFGTAIGQAALPALSKLSIEDEPEKFRELLLNSIYQIIFLALPLSVLFVVLRIPIVRVVFGSRSFPWEATIQTGQILAILCLSAGFYAVMQIIIRGFYALHDTKSPLIIGLIAAIGNALMSFFVVAYLGLGVHGLAWAITLTSIVETIVLLALLLRRIGRVENPKYYFVRLAKMTLASGCMGVVLWMAMRFFDAFVFDTTRAIPLVFLSFMTSLIGVIIYVVMAYVLKINELLMFRDLLLKIGKWQDWLRSTPPESHLVTSDQT